MHGSTTDVALIANAIDNGPDGLLDLVDGRRGFQQVLVITAGDVITVADLEGEILIEHTRPAPGLTYVGNRRPAAHANTAESSPMS
jgi:putative transposase